MNAVENLAISRARLRTAVATTINSPSLYQKFKKSVISKVSSTVAHYPLTAASVFFLGGAILVGSRPWSWKIELTSYKPWLAKLGGFAGGISIRTFISLVINEALKSRGHEKQA